jgi:CHAT domain-containing protein/tetratricopeptide (TPR) repeat protein
MSPNRPRWIWTAALVLSLSSLAFTQGSSPNPQDAAALRAIVDRYFAAYASGDIEAYSALWSANGLERTGRRQGMEAIFAAGSYSFSPIRISRLEAGGNQGRLWATTTRTLVRGSGNFVTKIGLSLGFIREDGVWKIAREGPAVTELAALLINARSDAEREDLLGVDRELLSQDLLMLLKRSTDRHFAAADYARALESARIVLRVAEVMGSVPDQATAWRDIGNLQFNRREMAAALEAYRKALAFNAGLDRKTDLINIWMGIGLAENGRSNIDPAIAAFEKALSLSEEIGDKEGVASALAQIANLYRESGRYELAATTYRRAIPLREAAKDRNGLARLLTLLAEVEYDQGESEAAIAAYVRAIPLLDDRLAVSTLHNLANLYYLQGRYDLAFANYDLEREAAVRSRNQKGEAAALVGLGLVKTLYGDYVEALDSYQKNLALVEQLADAEELPFAEQRVGGAYYALNNYEQALAHYQRELNLREAAGDKAEIAWALLDVGKALLGKGDHAAALEHATRSRGLFEELKDQIGIGTVWLHVAGIHLKRGEYQEARTAAEQSATIARAANDTLVYWQARHRVGKALFKLKQYPAARPAFTDAIATIEAQRMSAGDGRPQRALESGIAPYLAMVDLAVEMNQSGEAFSHGERAKLRALRWMIESGRVRITKTMAAPEIAREQELGRQVATLYTQFSRAREKKEPPARLSELQTQIRKARTVVTEFETQLFLRRPQLKVYRGAGAAATPDQAAPFIVAPRTAILEFIETEEQIFLFVLTRGNGKSAAPRMQGYALGVTRQEIAEPILALRQKVAAHSEGWEGPAEQLYDLLLKPAEELLRNQTQLTILPDGLLWNIPFALLRPAEGEMLIESHALAFAPSLSSLRLARARRPATGTSVPLLAFGHPMLNPTTIERLRLTRRVERLTTPPETAREVAGLGSLYPTGRIYTGADARVDRLRSEAGAARLIHLAAPATINEASPFYSHLALAAVPDDTQGNGIVEAREFFDWELRAELLTLSAAEIAPRSLGTGKGLIGMDWALAIAGCPTLLISQWPIEGTAASDLQLGFYTQLQKGGGKAKAWQKAVGELLKTTEYRHPFYWAGTVIIGEGF